MNSKLRIPLCWKDGLFEPLMAFALLAALFATIRRRTNARNLAFAWSACGCFTVALAVHAVQTYAYVGQVMTNSWYAAPAWPLELFLVATGFALLPARLGKALCIAMAAACFLQELCGTLSTMATGYGATPHVWAAWQRLAELRPAVLGTPTLVGLTIVYVGMAILLLLSLAATRSAPSHVPASLTPVPSSADG